MITPEWCLLMGSLLALSLTVNVIMAVELEKFRRGDSDETK